MGHGPQRDAPSWACPVTLEDMKRLIAETRRLMPEIGIQVPPNLSDWWPELVAAGATDLGGPERQRRPHLARAPVPVAGAGAQAAAPRTAIALSERLCVYPEYIDPEWIARAGARRDHERATGRSSRAAAAAGAAELTVADDVAPRAVERARDGHCAHAPRS